MVSETGSMDSLERTQRTMALDQFALLELLEALKASDVSELHPGMKDFFAVYLRDPGTPPGQQPFSASKECAVVDHGAGLVGLALKN